MDKQKIEAHKITKPIQLMAVWFIALLLLDSAFLTAAVKIGTPTWLGPTLAISAIIFVPLFLGGVFLMQTVFRKELQEDQYYSEMLKRQEETFKGFKPENVVAFKSNINIKTATNTPDLIINDTNSTHPKSLEEMRISSYEAKKGLFLVHTWRPSLIQNQIADIVIWLHQHGNKPLSESGVNKVEYQLGEKFFKYPKIKTDISDSFRLEVSAYGPMLCIAWVYFKNLEKPIMLERYINFEEAPNQALKMDRAGRATLARVSNNNY